MLKIRISYDEQWEREAEQALSALSPMMEGARVRKLDGGGHKRVYIETRGKKRTPQSEAKR